MKIQQRLLLIIPLASIAVVAAHAADDASTQAQKAATYDEYMEKNFYSKYPNAERTPNPYRTSTPALPEGIATKTTNNWSFEFGPAYSNLSTKLSGIGVISERESLNLYGGEIAAAYHFKGSELGISTSVLAGSKTIGAFDTDVIYSTVKAYYHFNYVFNDTFSVYAGPAFGVTVLSVDTQPTGTGIKGSDTALSPNIGADAGMTFNLTEQFALRLGYSFTYTAGTRLDFGYPAGILNTKLDDIMAHQVSLKASYRF